MKILNKRKIFKIPKMSCSYLKRITINTINLLRFECVRGKRRQQVNIFEYGKGMSLVPSHCLRCLKVE